MQTSLEFIAECISWGEHPVEESIQAYWRLLGLETASSKTILHLDFVLGGTSAASKAPVLWHYHFSQAICLLFELMNHLNFLTLTSFSYTSQVTKRRGLKQLPMKSPAAKTPQKAYKHVDFINLKNVKEIVDVQDNDSKFVLAIFISWNDSL